MSKPKKLLRHGFVVWSLTRLVNVIDLQSPFHPCHVCCSFIFHSHLRSHLSLHMPLSIHWPFSNIASCFDRPTYIHKTQSLLGTLFGCSQFSSFLSNDSEANIKKPWLILIGSCSVPQFKRTHGFQLARCFQNYWILYVCSYRFQFDSLHSFSSFLLKTKLE